MTRASRMAAVVTTLVALAQFQPASQAAFNGRTTNPGSSFATTALYAPSNLTATPSGSNVSLSWSAGQNGSGYRIDRAANGSSSSCTGVTYTAIATTASLSYTDTPGAGGPWFCYRVVTTYGVWTSVTANPTVAVQVGNFRLLSVSASNGSGSTEKLDLGDTIVFTFSEAVNPATAPSGTNTICITKVAEPNAQILVGLTATAGACSTSQTRLLGEFIGAGSDKDGRYEATWTWSNGNTVLTVVIGNVAAGSYPKVTGTLTFLPTTTTTYVRSQAGNVHVCDTGAACQPVMTGSF